MEIKDLIEDFFQNTKPTFSQNWKNDIFDLIQSRKENLRTVDLAKQIIQKTHWKEYPKVI